MSLSYEKMKLCILKKSLFKKKSVMKRVVFKKKKNKNKTLKKKVKSSVDVRKTENYVRNSNVLLQIQN